MTDLSIADPRGLAYVGTRRRTGIAWAVPPHLVERFQAVLGTITATDPGPHHCFHGIDGGRIWLVPNATETRWFHALLEECTALCFVLGRVAFLNEDGVPVKNNPRGSVIFYRGACLPRFRAAMSGVGSTAPLSWQDD